MSLGLKIALRVLLLGSVLLSMLIPAPRVSALAYTAIQCQDVNEIPESECLALVALYDSTNGSGWIDHTNWLVTLTPSNWVGVVVESGHVTQLNLDENGLLGTIPSELSDLAYLTRLSLHSNQLYGSIPAALSDLTALRYLYLYGNQLSGSIPPELGVLPNLWNLWLSNNQLSGPIPAALGQLPSLQYLRLANNQFTGGIPVELGTLTGLQHLSLGNNLLSGPIPAVLGNLTNLFALSLAGNQLTGPIPQELGALTNLAELDLSANLLEGDIPYVLGTLTNLEVLHLQSNALTGDVPANFVNLTALADPGDVEGEDGLDLDYNRLNVPADYPSDTLNIFLSQKDPQWHILQATKQVIGNAGGSFTSRDGRVSISVPTGMLGEDVTFTFAPQYIPHYSTAGLAFANNSFQLIAQDAQGNLVTVFTQPITVSVIYSDADLLSLFEATLALYTWNTSASAWVDAVIGCGAYVFDPVNNTFSLPICHLSEFAVLGNPAFDAYLPVIRR